MTLLAPKRGYPIAEKDGRATDRVQGWMEKTSSEVNTNAAAIALLQDSGRLIPVGGLAPFAGTTAPDGWLMCDGSAVSRTDYADLFEAIGDSYGVGDGTSTFNVPDLQGRVPVGLDSAQTEFDTLGETGGEKTHTLITDEMPSHQHSVSGTAASNGGHIHNVAGQDTAAGGSNAFGVGDLRATFSGATPYSTSSNGSHTHTVSGTAASTGGGGAHNNLQPYQVVNYIICASPIA